MRKLGVLVLVLSLLATTGCSVKGQRFEHDPSMAAAVALEYTRLLLIEGDISAAYELVDEETRGRISREDLGATIKTAPGYGDVISLKATEYELMPGQAAVSIYLTGRAMSRSYDYLVILSGSMDSGYRVADLRLITDPQPPSGMRRKLQEG